MKILPAGYLRELSSYSQTQNSVIDLVSVSLRNARSAPEDPGIAMASTWATIQTEPRSGCVRYRSVSPLQWCARMPGSILEYAGNSENLFSDDRLKAPGPELLRRMAPVWRLQPTKDSPIDG